MLGVAVLTVLVVGTSSSTMNVRACANTTFRCPTMGCRAVVMPYHTSFEICRDNFERNYPDRSSGAVGSGVSDLEVVPRLFKATYSKGSKSYVGLNITLSVKPRISAVLLWISISAEKKSLCTAVLIDEVTEVQLTELWTCTYFDEGEIDMDYSINAMTYPQSQNWLVMSTVRHLSDFDSPRSVEDWIAAVYLTAAYTHSSWKACFQQIPERFGTFNYSLTLKSVHQEDESIILGSARSDVLCKTYRHLKPANYTAEVKLSPCPSETCRTSSTPTLIISPAPPRSNRLLIIIFSVIGVFVVGIVLIFCICFRTYRSPKHAKVVLLYTHDNAIQNHAVDALDALLRVHGVEVFIDKRSLPENPLKWLQSMIRMDDVVVVAVFSSGAIYRAKKTPAASRELFEGEPGHLTGHLFSTAMQEVLSRHSEERWNRRIFIGVTWDKAKKKEAKSILPHFTHYCLPEEWNKFHEHVRTVRTFEQLQCLSLKAWVRTSHVDTAPGASDAMRRFSVQCRRVKENGGNFNIASPPNHLEAVDDGKANRNGEPAAGDESGYYSCEPNPDSVPLVILPNGEAADSHTDQFKYKLEEERRLRSLLGFK